MGKLRAIPISRESAQEFVNGNHRHHKAPIGDIYRIGCVSGGKLVGVAIVGRPVSRVLDDGSTVEVTRLCTDGTRNACSFLYSRCARIAQEFGYSKIITYILESETGTSLLASGWKMEAFSTGGGEWNTPCRKRQTNQYPTQKKQRWSKELNPVCIVTELCDGEDPQLQLF